LEIGIQGRYDPERNKGSETTNRGVAGLAGGLKGHHGLEGILRDPEKIPLIEIVPLGDEGECHGIQMSRKRADRLVGLKMGGGSGCTHSLLGLRRFRRNNP